MSTVKDSYPGGSQLDAAKGVFYRWWCACGAESPYKFTTMDAAIRARHIHQARKHGG